MNNWKKVFRALVPVEGPFNALVPQGLKVHLITGETRFFPQGSHTFARETFLIIKAPQCYEEQKTGEYTNVSVIKYEHITDMEWYS